MVLLIIMFKKLGLSFIVHKTIKCKVFVDGVETMKRD